MERDGLELDRQGRTAWLWLSKPQRHNALDDAMIVALTDLLKQLGEDASVDRLVLAGAGKSFCAGADISWMRRTADYSEAENIADARTLALLMRTLDEFPKPTIARIQGPVYGGGVGLVACCDIAIATPDAAFSLSEVKLGLIPAAISPVVIAAIGPRAARRYFLTAELFDAAEALRIGLVHALVAPEKLDEEVAAVIDSLSQCGPLAVTAAKQLVADVSTATRDDALLEDTAGRIARARAGPEGREGLTAFLEKRPPRWPRD